MCLLVLLYRAVDDAPIIIGANREEAYARPGESPQLFTDGPSRFMAGRDPREGGTWLGVNEHGLLIAVTNRPKSNPPERSRSRGLLVKDLLSCENATLANEMATKELEKDLYRGCNLLCADRERAVMIQAGDWLRTRLLPPGIHVITNGDLNDESDQRIHHCMHWLYQQSYSQSADCLNALKQLCPQTGNGTPAICLKGKEGGTVSSSLIALRRGPANSSWWHAQGSPAETPYEDYSSLLQSLSSE